MEAITIAPLFMYIRARINRYLTSETIGKIFSILKKQNVLEVERQTEKNKGKRCMGRKSNIMRVFRPRT